MACDTWHLQKYAKGMKGMKRFAKVWKIANKSQGNYPGSTVIDMGKYWESTRKITVFMKPQQIMYSRMDLMHS